MSRRKPPPPAPRKRRPVIGQAAEVVPPTQGPPAPNYSWVDWYNAATAEEQRDFDRAGSVIDNGGAPYQKGGKFENYVENWRSKGAPFYQALVNYRDTGGRKALFAVPPKDYGPRPISTAKQGGPIERQASNMLVLHPGKYTYTDVTQNGPAFRQWLAIVKSAVTVGQTQIATAVLAGDPYYVDYEFLVSQDTAWPDAVNGNRLQGTPTWLPTSINIIDYWGQVTKSSPDWGWPGRQLDAAGGILKGVGTVAAFLAMAYVMYNLRPNPTPHAR
jgi:hypothetical protein